ncbi:MAG: DUF2378 family protein [Myxococcales bacterium]|nr:DUF2378 family protein [Myxococcales bacterium]
MEALTSEGGLVVDPNVALRGSYDSEAVARAIPAHWVAKGMFFSRLSEILGPDLEALASKLDAPPRRGRYTAFLDYPQRDYERLTAAAARKLYPNLAMSEATRRLGREDFEVFGSSTIGKVTLAVVGDAHAALLMTPSIYKKMAPGEYTFEGRALDDRSVRFELQPSYGHFAYPLGQFEGVVMHYGVRPRTVVKELAEHKLRLDITIEER